MSRISDAARKLLEETVKREGYKWQSDFANAHIAEGQARSVLLLLEKRGIPVPNETRDRIHDCTDPDQFDRMLLRAMVVGTAEDLFT